MLEIRITNEELYNTMLIDDPNTDSLSYLGKDRGFNGTVSFHLTHEGMDILAMRDVKEDGMDIEDSYWYNNNYYCSTGEHSSSDFEEQFGFVIEWQE